MTTTTTALEAWLEATDALVLDLVAQADRARDTRKLGDAALLASAVPLAGETTEALGRISTALGLLSNELLRHVAHHPPAARFFAGWKAPVKPSTTTSYDASRLLGVLASRLADQVARDVDPETGEVTTPPPAVIVDRTVRAVAEMAGADTASTKWKIGGPKAKKRGLADVGINPNDYATTTTTEKLGFERAG